MLRTITSSADAAAGLFQRVVRSLPEGRAIAEDVWRRRHRGMIILLWIHVPIIVVFSGVTGHGWGHGMLEAGLVAIAALAAQKGPDRRRFRSVAATFGLTASSAILVHLSGGYIEFHFHYFFTLAVISLYHDWAPFLAALLFVVVQHGVAGVLDPHAVYNHADGIAHPWKWAGIHATFVLATSVVSLIRWKASEVEALKDPLTGLPNRALFADRLQQMMLRRDPAPDVAVMFLDIDDFKSINDTAGHAAGDKLLIVVADRLRSVMRPGDTVARLGGDEFAIVADVGSRAQVRHIAARILDVLRTPFVFEERSFPVTASLGIAMRGDSAGEAELVRDADIAMYEAKKNGKAGFAIFEPSMRIEILERAELARDLGGAVERGEMSVLYQPVVRLDDGAITGVEALIRWRHPAFGTFGPARFIPLAEETGDIVAIDRWVMETACLQAKEWDRDLGTQAPQSISVNLSVRELVEDDFVESIQAVLQRTSLPPERLILELTESAMVEEGEQVVRQLGRLKELGVRIALDDFGTGYSSLGYLRRLPIDILKVDKTFVDGTDGGSEDAALARAILKIARSLGLHCIAEGVERAEQAAALREAGCEFAQGFLFAKPVSPIRIAAMVQSWAPVALDPAS